MRRRRGNPSPQWTSAASRRLLELAGRPKDIAAAVSIIATGLLEGVDCPPTDLKAVGSALNVRRFQAEDIPFSGELRRESDGFVVAYSRYLSTPRRRFTIAHELGHAVFERSGPNCPRTGNELERLCDMIATELLMPRGQFLAQCGSADQVNWPRIIDLASQFQSSISATAIRCAELLGLTVFEVRDERVRWAYGSVSGGPVMRLHPELQTAIELAKKRDSFELILYLGSQPRLYQWWRLESKVIGAEGSIFFLMVPKGRRLRKIEEIIPDAG